MDFNTKVQVVAGAAQQILTALAALYALFGHGRAIKLLQQGQQSQQQQEGPTVGS